MNEPGEGREATEQDEVRHRAADVLAGDDGGRDGEDLAPPVLHLVQPQLPDGAAGVDEDEPTRFEATEDVDLVQQGRVLDDEGIGCLLYTSRCV